MRFPIRAIRSARTVILSTWILAAFGGVTAAKAESPPPWMFPNTTASNALPPDDGKLKSVPDSKVTLSVPQIRDFYSPPDWFPDEHAPMPSLVGRGVKPGIYACGYCHLPSGNGRPENANIAGLPADYIVRQVEDMKSGARSSSLPAHFPQKLMLELAVKAAVDPGLKEAADYFAALKPRAVVKVVETDTIPKVDIFRWVYIPAAGGGTEPLVNRMVELMDDFERFENRDGHVTYAVYVPPGSLARGEALVKNGAGAAGPCASCHGEGLKGKDAAPPIAGRSPSYAARQLFDMKHGARNGAGMQVMKPVVANMTNEDIIAVTAYLATLAP